MSHYNLEKTMCIRQCETNKDKMEVHNINLRRQAAERLNALAKMRSHRREDAAHNRKSGQKLQARIADWQKSIDDPMNRGKDMSGYHKPGSLKKIH